MLFFRQEISFGILFFFLFEFLWPGYMKWFLLGDLVLIKFFLFTIKRGCGVCVEKKSFIVIFRRVFFFFFYFGDGGVVSGNII